MGRHADFSARSRRQKPLNRKGILAANWEPAGKKWTVPFGGGAGRVFKIGKLPINIMLAGCYNLVKPQ